MACTAAMDHLRERQYKRMPTGTLPASWSWDLLYFKGWRLVIGGWRLVAIGGWRRLAAVGGWRLVVDGGWRLAVGGGWRLAVGSWWSLGAGQHGCDRHTPRCTTATRQRLS